MADATKENTRSSSDTEVTNAEFDEIAPHTEGQPSAPRGRRRAGPWLFVLVVLIGLPAAWIYAPQEMRQQVLDSIAPRGKTPAPIAAPKAPEPAGAPGGAVPAGARTAADHDIADMPEKTPAEPAVPPEPEQASAAAVSSEPAASGTPARAEEAPAAGIVPAMRADIERLQSELATLRAEKQTLADKLDIPQPIELRAWLELLASAETPLSQRAGMWAYLASRPSLDDAARTSAREMADVLAGDRQTIEQMRQALGTLADGIPDPFVRELIPEPENPYFAWLSGTFHLHRAAAPIDGERALLRGRLQAMQHALAIGDWPDTQAWRRLMRDVQDAIPGADEVTTTKLSDDMDRIRADIESSRNQAGKWAEGL